MKTLWKKEEMLVTSIFSFSHGIFYPIKARNPPFSNIFLSANAFTKILQFERKVLPVKETDKRTDMWTDRWMDRMKFQ